MSDITLYEISSNECPELTWEGMRNFLTLGWGGAGEKAFADYQKFNERFFQGQLPPTHLSFNYTSQYGRWLGQCAFGEVTPHGTRPLARISLCRPLTNALPARFRGYQYSLCADSAVLLHEMLHLYLFQRGEPAGHSSAGWIDGVLRMSAQLGVNIDYQPQVRHRIPVVDENGDCETTPNKRVKRSQQRFTPANSLSFDELQCWPHTVPETLLELPISFAGGEWPEQELGMRQEAAYLHEVQELRLEARALSLESVEHQQAFIQQLTTRYHRAHNLARYDLEGLIDAVQRPSKLKNERPTNKNVQWSEKLGCWVLVNKGPEILEEESIEESMEELY